MIRIINIRNLALVVSACFAIGCAGTGDGNGQDDVGQSDDDIYGAQLVSVGKAGSVTGAAQAAAEAPSAHPTARFGPHPDPWTGGPDDPSGPHPDPWNEGSRPSPAPTPDPK